MRILFMLNQYFTNPLQYSKQKAMIAYKWNGCIFYFVQQNYSQGLQAKITDAKTMRMLIMLN